MGKKECEWVRMGADGCVGVPKARETQKEVKQGSFGVLQDRIWSLWPGKFPRTSCFWVFDKKWCRWVQVHTERFGWVRTDVGARGEALNKGKRSPNGLTGDVLRCMHTMQKSMKWSAMTMLVRGYHLEEWRVIKRFAVRYICAT